MANFPNSVWSPTVKNSGDVIQPSHINDAQDEIVAIEAGIRNGTAPVNSSNSTIANLSVPGNSTFGSSITIGGQPMIFPAAGGSSGQVLMITSTSGSTMTLGWRTVQGNDQAVLFHDNTQSITDNTWTPVSLRSKDFDNNSSMASTATFNITIQSSGIFHLVGRSHFYNASGNFKAGLRFLVNSTTYIDEVTHYTGSTGGIDINISAVRNLNAATTIGLQAIMNAGGLGTDVLSTSANREQMSELAVYRIR